MSQVVYGITQVGSLVFPAREPSQPNKEFFFESWRRSKRPRTSTNKSAGADGTVIWAQFGHKNSPTAPRALSTSPGSRCEYTRNVAIDDSCPTKSATPEPTPAEIRADAYRLLRPCNGTRPLSPRQQRYSTPPPVAEGQLPAHPGQQQGIRQRITARQIAPQAPPQSTVAPPPRTETAQPFNGSQDHGFALPVDCSATVIAPRRKSSDLITRGSAISLSLSPPPTHTHTHKARCPPRSRTPAPPTSTQLRHGLDLAQGLQTVRKTFPAPCLRPGDVLCRGRDDAVQGGGLECGFQRGERLPCRGRRQRCSFCPRPAGFEYAYPCTNVYWAQSGQGGTGEAS